MYSQTSISGDLNRMTPYSLTEEDDNTQENKDIEVEGEIINNLPIGHFKVFFSNGETSEGFFGKARKLLQKNKKTDA